MIGYTQQEIAGSQKGSPFYYCDDVMTFYKFAVKYVEALPDIEGLRCHEVVRGFTSVIERLKRNAGHLRIVDGKYGVVEHSWIHVYSKFDTIPESPIEAVVERMNGNVVHPRLLLDLYSVGRMPMVQLIDLDGILPHRSLYTPGELRSDIRQETVSLLGWIAREV